MQILLVSVKKCNSDMISHKSVIYSNFYLCLSRIGVLSQIIAYKVEGLFKSSFLHFLLFFAPHKLNFLY